MTTVITSDLIPLRERGRFQSYGNIAYAVSALDFFSLLLKYTMCNILNNLKFSHFQGWICAWCSIGWFYHRLVWVALLFLHQFATHVNDYLCGYEAFDKL